MPSHVSNVHDRHDLLCRTCCNVDFNRYLSEELTTPVSLGYWKTVQQKAQHCKFCRLVVHALSTNIRYKPPKHDAWIVLSNQLSWQLGIELSPYDRSRSESYSNKYDLRSKAKKCAQTVYRFIVKAQSSRASQSPCLGIIQYLAHREKSWHRRQFFGRKIAPDTIDLDLVKTWLAECPRWHQGSCDRHVQTANTMCVDLRLIDVNRRCVIKVTKGVVPEFVALSYMWGTKRMKEDTGKDPVVLLQKDIRFDADGKEMSLLSSTLPRTIEDAIKLTRNLGYSYLWTDALCIIQDKPADAKIPDLMSMKMIYSASSLTIAAAGGQHADYGIPGVGTRRRSGQYSEVIRGLRFAVMLPSYTDSEGSSSIEWNTRAWTFQEKLLSTRILLFTDYQVYFKCSEAIWSEDVHLETQELSKSVEARKAKYAWDPNREVHKPSERALDLKASWDAQLNIVDEWHFLGGFLNYASAVEEYCKRHLGDQNDILFAISGIFETLEPATGRYLAGLPRKHFLDALLWYPEIGCEQSKTVDSKLPSWSWASWKFGSGTITYRLMDIRTLRHLVSVATQTLANDHTTAESESLGQSSIGTSLRGTYRNLLSCVRWPLLQSDHTIKRLYHSDGLQMRRVKFEPPASSIINDEAVFGDVLNEYAGVGETDATDGRTGWKPDTDQYPHDAQILSFETVIVRLFLGRSLSVKHSTSEDAVGLFELTNRRGETIGELVTTCGRAARCRGAQDFMSMSWSFSLEHVELHERWIPRWRYDGDSNRRDSILRSNINDNFSMIHRLAHARRIQEGDDMNEDAADLGRKVQKDQSEKYEKTDIRDEALHTFVDDIGIGITNMNEISKLIGKIEPYVPGRWFPKANRLALKEAGRDSTFELLREFVNAKKGMPKPRNLWPVVNLILVDWDGKIARRAGVGKIIMEAWQDEKGVLQEVMFG